MTTRTICDYPACGEDAAWKVELSDLSPLASWEFYGDISHDKQARHSMDVCSRHLPAVTFDQDKIAEFEERFAPSSEKDAAHD